MFHSVTFPVSDISGPSINSSVFEDNSLKRSNQSEVTLLFENVSLPSTTEEQSVIRTTEELDRNMTETSINLIQSSLNDIMIRDQSSTKSNNIIKSTEEPTTESVITSPSPKIETAADNISKIVLDNLAVEKDNIIETKQVPEDKEPPKEVDKSNVENIENKIQTLESTSKNLTTNNEVSSIDSSDVKEPKTAYVNESYNFVLTASTTISAPDGVVDSSKVKPTNEFLDLDSMLSEILGEGGDESKSLEDDEEDEKPKQTTTLPPIFDPFETTIMSDLDEEDEVDEKYDEEPAIPMDKPTHNVSKSEKSTQVNVVDTATTETPIKSKVTITDYNLNTTQTITEMTTVPSTVNLTPESPTKSNTVQISTEPLTSSETNLSSDLEQKSTTQITPNSEMNSTSSYVTSFDVVSNGNTTQVVTKTPTEGDINWYSIDTKPMSVPTAGTTKLVSSDITTITAPIETTNEPEPEMTTESSHQETTVAPESAVTGV